MPQYQSFPSAPGGSRSSDKLFALRMPPLTNKSFLDVGCNEGFFCGYAEFAGASRIVGIDRVEASIRAAKRRFPRCEFLAQSWDELPPGPFDVILLASALHYAEDQPDLIRRLLAHLSPTGKLVLELGVAAHGTGDWVTVRRGDSDKQYPTWDGVTRMLEGWAWRRIGPSVKQAGDPVPRYVVHVIRRRATAYLLMAPPAFGKTSICRALFKPAGVTVVGGDRTITQIARGELEAPASLVEVVRAGAAPFQIKPAIERVFASGLGAELIDVWLSRAGSGDFVLDSYVPKDHYALVKEMVGERGYHVVSLDWSRFTPLPTSDATARALVSEYEAWLETRELAPKTSSEPVRPQRKATIGHVDKVSIADGRIRIRGWAIDPAGRLPDSFVVRAGKAVHIVQSFEQVSRPRVSRKFGLHHSVVGFQLSIPFGEGFGSPPRLDVAAGSQSDSLRQPFNLRPAVRRQLAKHWGLRIPSTLRGLVLTGLRLLERRSRRQAEDSGRGPRRVDPAGEGPSVDSRVGE